MVRIKKGNTKTIDSFLRLMGLQSDGNQKGNKGRGAAQRRLQFLGGVCLLLVGLLGAVHLCFPAKSAVVSDRVARHAKKLRRKMLKGKGASFGQEEIIDLILQGNLNLVDIKFDRRALSRADDDVYEGATGIFCHLNFAAHKKDPSGVPMFRDMVGKSPMCEGEYDENNPEDNRDDVPRGKVRFDLKEIADMARQSDKYGDYPHTKNLDLKGVVFHESRCGSTLVANSLIAMNPVKHRVYSESAPPIAALKVCGQAVDGDEEESPCSIDQGAKILRDVMFLMGRSSDSKEERYFFKIQSAGTQNLAIFRRAFPATPWIFVYRDPVQVMMSHFAQGSRSAVCLRSRRKPPRILQRLARKRGYTALEEGQDDASGSDDKEKDLESMGPHEYCAAHLATLTETAADHIHQSSGLGRPVNYANLPHILYEQILPAWDVPVSETEKENIQKISGVYSKGRGDMKGEWHEDSEKKEAMASPEVQEAAKIFLQRSFDQLEKIASRY